jgi:hypothetical protein
LYNNNDSKEDRTSSWYAMYEYIKYTTDKRYLTYMYLWFYFYHLAYSLDWFDVRKSMHHHTIQINKLTRYNSFTSLFTWRLCVAQNVSGASPSIIRTRHCTRSTDHILGASGFTVAEWRLVMVWRVNPPDHDQQRSSSVQNYHATPREIPDKCGSQALCSFCQSFEFLSNTLVHY